MSLSTEINKRLFIAGVVSISIIPRHQVVRDRCSIGGEISHPFRKLLLVVAALSFMRPTLSAFPPHSWLGYVADIEGVISQLGQIFICLLTPYLLQTWLAPLINIGGKPGANLMLPLYLTTTASIISVALIRFVHLRFWSLRVLATVISTPPVLDTLKMFNSVTTRGGHHEGRGTVLSQSLMATEWWFAVTQLLCAIGYGLEVSKDPSEYTLWDSILAAFRKIKFLSDWTRILVHAIFMNQLDEIYLSYSPAHPSTDREDQGAEDSYVSDTFESTLLLVPKKGPRRIAVED